MLLLKPQDTDVKHPSSAAKGNRMSQTIVTYKKATIAHGLCVGGSEYVREQT